MDTLPRRNGHPTPDHHPKSTSISINFVIFIRPKSKVWT